jgi:hypothetical protein
MVLRLFKRRTGEHTLVVDSTTRDIENRIADENSQHVEVLDIKDRDHTSDSLITDKADVPENLDPRRVRFHKYRGLTRLRRRLRNLRRLGRFIRKIFSKDYSLDEKLWMLTNFREWQPIDLEDHRRNKAEEDMLAEHKKQADILKPTIINVLVRLKYCKYENKHGREYITERPVIGYVEVSPHAYTYYITRIPFGIRHIDMASEETATELSVSVRKKVRAELDADGGLRYTVMIASTLSIPNFVPFSDFAKMAKNKPPLTFFLGHTTNGLPVFPDLADAPHMIVAGQTGGGKSNLINGLICSLITRQSPEIIQFLFVDLKEGVEFAPFYDIPHMWRYYEDDGVVERPDKVLPALKALHHECDRRLNLFKTNGFKNITGYNRGKLIKNRLPFLVVPFDEWATAKLLGGAKVENELILIANKSRAAGIHFILGTQYPKAELLSPLISINFTARVAFNMTTGASQSVLGSWDAHGLSPTGRAVFQTARGQMYVQTPRITDATIASIVKSVNSGDKQIEISTVDHEEVLEWALDNNDGRLSREAIYGHFKERMSDNKVRSMLKAMIGQTYEIRDMLYKVSESNGGNIPSRMEIVTETGVYSPEITTDTQYPTEFEAVTTAESEE